MTSLFLPLTFYSKHIQHLNTIDVKIALFFPELVSLFMVKIPANAALNIVSYVHHNCLIRRKFPCWIWRSVIFTSTHYSNTYPWWQTSWKFQRENCLDVMIPKWYRHRETIRSSAMDFNWLLWVFRVPRVYSSIQMCSTKITITLRTTHIFDAFILHPHFGLRTLPIIVIHSLTHI